MLVEVVQEVWARVEHSFNDELTIFSWRFTIESFQELQYLQFSSQIPRQLRCQAKAPVSTSALWTQYFPVDKKEEAPAVGTDPGLCPLDNTFKQGCSDPSQAHDSHKREIQERNWSPYLFLYPVSVCGVGRNLVES